MLNLNLSDTIVQEGVHDLRLCHTVHQEEET